MPTYAIGDIQGCYDAFCRLLDEIRFDAATDRLWLVGDLVNRGPQSLEVLRHVKQLGPACTTVLGNHDLHLLAVEAGTRQRAAGDTLDAVLAAPDRAELVDWLRQLPLFFFDEELGYALVHAGLPPQWSIDDAARLAREVEQCIRGEAATEFFAGMYGNEPKRWSEDLRGVERLRVITNYLTRMRYCAADGSLDLSQKAAPRDLSSGARHLPWFAHEARRSRDTRIVFGHWASLRGQVDVTNVYALDTGCVWGGTLTALRLDDHTRFECGCAG